MTTWLQCWLKCTLYFSSKTFTKLLKVLWNWSRFQNWIRKISSVKNACTYTQEPCHTQTWISHIGFGGHSLGVQNLQSQLEIFSEVFELLCLKFCNTHSRVTCLSIFLFHCLPVTVRWGHNFHLGWKWDGKISVAYGLVSTRVAESEPESEVFEWSRNRIFCPTPDAQLDHFLHHTPKLVIPVEMVQFFEIFVETEISYCASRFPLILTL